MKTESRQPEQGELFTEEYLDLISGNLPDYSDLPSFPNPSNDNEKMLQSQYLFRHGDTGALGGFYKAGMHSGLNFAWKMREGDSALKSMDMSGIRQAVHDAISDIVAKMLEDRRFVLKCASAYVYKRVKTALKPYTKEIDRLTDSRDISEIPDL